ncbi:hypothetical protein [uncultured Capnocytophaga sp.]|uniref:hypothetical protein n=1 Tax=uncultured Capnocytophaga sp. TaxID=159273 RepID=UPI00261560BD|nr:hypothetical protein [uncultured Capnocytophaga sp.]
MAIRLVSGCVNCENLTAENVCKLYNIKVELKHTCDDFNMRPSLKDEVDCLSCSKYKTQSCANQLHAAEGMLCNEWAPDTTAEA